MSQLSRRDVFRCGLALVGAGVLAGCAAVTQRVQSSGPRRIGFLSPDPGSPRTVSAEAFVGGLRDLGYVEGRDVEIVYRWGEGREDRLPALAAELVELRVEIIAAEGAAAGLAARGATAEIPIVVGASNDPVEAGLVASLARPGGNVTGLSLVAPLIGAKRVQLLKEAVPRVGRVAAIAYAGSTTLERDWDEAQQAARALGLEIARHDVRAVEEFPAALAAMAADGADALLLLQNRFFSQNRPRLLELAAGYRLPTMGDNPNFAQAGGLMSYGADPADLYRRAATYVDKILRGAKPADLPVEQPTKFDFVVNLKTAQALGLTIPQSVLQQTTDVIR